MNDTEEPSWRHPPSSHETEVDSYGIPVDAFGERVTSGFFEVLGRILSVHGKIEYLEERLGHLSPAETAGVKKTEQFLARCAAGKAVRNTIVHSYWVFGAHRTDPDIILAVRYKVRNQTSGQIATLSIMDVPESDRGQDVGQYTLGDLKAILRRSIQTMRIGEQAYSKIILRWAVGQTDNSSASLSAAETAKLFEINNSASIDGGDA